MNKSVLHNFLSQQKRLIEICSLILNFYSLKIDSKNFHNFNFNSFAENIQRIKVENSEDKFECKNKNWNYFVEGLNILTDDELKKLTNLTLEIISILSTKIQLSNLIDPKNFLKSLLYFFVVMMKISLKNLSLLF